MTYIISLGGSLIAPDGVDISYIKKFRRVLLGSAKSGHKFLIIPGGGQTARTYQKEARNITKISNDDLDWIGIGVNRLHSTFLRSIFGSKAHPEVVGLNSKLDGFKKRIAVGVGGLAPGGTSDSTAVRFTQKLHAKTIINLTNVAGVYDRDPRKFRNAKLIRNMTWGELKKQFGTGRSPGRNLPFDSSIAPLAARLKLKVVILNGKDLKNFQNFLSGKSFRGTVIQ